jgi:hypothetical protein
VFRILEVPGSNIGPETSYSVSVSPGKRWESTLKLGHDRFLPRPFQFIIHISPFFILRSIASVTEKASLNKL